MVARKTSTRRRVRNCICTIFIGLQDAKRAGFTSLWNIVVLGQCFKQVLRPSIRVHVQSDHSSEVKAAPELYLEFEPIKTRSVS